jgi:hypothetical protein
MTLVVIFISRTTNTPHSRTGNGGSISTDFWEKGWTSAAAPDAADAVTHSWKQDDVSSIWHIHSPRVRRVERYLSGWLCTQLHSIYIHTHGVRENRDYDGGIHGTAFDMTEGTAAGIGGVGERSRETCLTCQWRDGTKKKRRTTSVSPPAYDGPFAGHVSVNPCNVVLLFVKGMNLMVSRKQNTFCLFFRSTFFFSLANNKPICLRVNVCFVSIF